MSLGQKEVRMSQKKTDTREMRRTPANRSAEWTITFQTDVVWWEVEEEGEEELEGMDGRRAQLGPL